MGAPSIDSTGSQSVTTLKICKLFFATPLISAAIGTGKDARMESGQVPYSPQDVQAQGRGKPIIGGTRNWTT